MLVSQVLENEYSYLNLVAFKKLYNWSYKYAINTNIEYNSLFPLTSIGTFLKRNKTQVEIENGKRYKRVTIKLYNGGIYLRDTEVGDDIGTKKQFLIKKGQFLLSKIDARNGAFGVVPKSCDGAIITGNFWAFDVDYCKINPYFLTLLTTTKNFLKLSESSSNGTTNRLYLQENLFLKMKIPLPSIEKQKEIVENYNNLIIKAEQQEKEAENLEQNIEKYLFETLGLSLTAEQNNKNKTYNYLSFVNLKHVKFWGYDKLQGMDKFKSIKHKLYSLNTRPDAYIEIFRGKSPKYKSHTDSIILNQKCNRWNELEIEHAKTVESDWLKNIDKKFFTKEGDIIINSTGEGTIGRASYITKDKQGLLYDSHLLLLRLNDKIINPLYFTLILNSNFGQRQIDLIKSAQSTKQTELGIDNLKKIKIPIPEKDTQNTIANKLIRIQAEIKELKQNAEKIMTQAKNEFENEVFK